MRVKIIPCLAIGLLLTAAFPSCQKDPSTSGLHDDYTVYTACDEQTDFTAFETYYLPDSILLIGNSDKTEYWKDADAQRIIATVADNLTAAGYVRSDDKATADLGVQMSYVRRVTYFVGYDSPYWWWYYPYYWSPGYWGDWTGWHYPFAVWYGYTSGSMLVEMLDLEADRESGRKLPVVWDCYIAGLLTSSEQVNLQRTIDAVDQAFEQSSCLNPSGFNR